MLLNGAVLPDKEWVDRINKLTTDQALFYRNDIVEANPINFPESTIVY
ncbi:MAG: hypothetical protein K9H65_05425 [Bacteroidales bacterium]|nr:hypothetical protein [Bacteroidales bacterium]